MATAQRTRIKVADEVWVAAALLHREHPHRMTFTPQEITRRVQQEAIHGRLRPGVYMHAVQQCVANRPPNPGRYRMLYAVGKTRRLFRPGDSYHPDREGGKITPDRQELPGKYRYLLDWYFSVYAGEGERGTDDDPILRLRGLGKELWVDEDADSYVRRLREGWA